MTSNQTTSFSTKVIWYSDLGLAEQIGEDMIVQVPKAGTIFFCCATVGGGYTPRVVLLERLNNDILFVQFWLEPS